MNENTDNLGRLRGRDCPVCGGNEIRAVLTLPDTPLGDRFTKTFEEALALKYYSLVVGRCDGCGHCFLPLETPSDDSYLHYLFHSENSPGLLDSFREVVDDISNRHNLGDGDLVLDIGANDGSWLEFFSENGCDVIGVEPAPGPAKAAIDRGIPVVNDYFSPQSLLESGLLKGALRVVSMNYVFANLANPVSTLEGITEIAGEKTVISVMTGYHPAQLEVSMFDYVYHEHLAYFSCRDFQILAEKIGYTVTYAREIPLKGGSIHIEMQKSGPEVFESSIFQTMLKREAWLDQPSDSQWTRIADEIQKVGNLVRGEIGLVRSSGQKVIGFGASHSTTTLLHALGIASEPDLIIDDNPNKIGRYSPGSGIKVEPAQALRRHSGATVLLLAWQHSYQILDSLRQNGFRGTVIVPFPFFRSVEFS